MILGDGDKVRGSACKTRVKAGGRNIMRDVCGTPLERELARQDRQTPAGISRLSSRAAAFVVLAEAKVDNNVTHAYLLIYTSCNACGPRRWPCVAVALAITAPPSFHLSPLATETFCSAPIRAWHLSGRVLMRTANPLVAYVATLDNVCMGKMDMLSYNRCE